MIPNEAFLSLKLDHIVWRIKFIAGVSVHVPAVSAVLKLQLAQT